MLRYRERSTLSTPISPRFALAREIRWRAAIERLRNRPAQYRDRRASAGFRRRILQGRSQIGSSAAGGTGAASRSTALLGTNTQTFG